MVVTTPNNIKVFSESITSIVESLPKIKNVFYYTRTAHILSSVVEETSAEKNTDRTPVKEYGEGRRAGERA